MSRFGSLFVLKLLAIASLIAIFCSPAQAQLSQHDRERLAGEIEAAAKNLDPSLFPDLDDSKKDVLARVQAVQNFLSRQRIPDRRSSWLAYLKLDPLVKSIEEGESPATIAGKASDLRYRLLGTAPGLELSVLVELRSSLENLVEAIRFRDEQKGTRLLAKQLDTMAERVREMDVSPSADDAALVNAVVGILESSGQANRLVQSLRNTFSRPNIVISVTEPFVQSAINRNVDQSRPVRECILGTRIVGNASLNGIVTANLLPSFGSARVEVSLAAHVTSRNTGFNGPVRLRTIGHGDVNVARTLHINESGVNAEPAYARAELKVDITAIEHHLRLVRRIARSRAAEQKPQADRIAVEKLRQQVGSQFVSQTSEATRITPPDLFAEIRPVLRRLSLDEPTRTWASTDDAVFIDSTFRRKDQLSAVVSRPTIFQPYDVALQIHESVVDNALSPVLAGRTINEARLNELIEKSGLPMVSTQSDDAGDDSEPFEIDFARLRPVIFEARDQTVRLGVRGTRFAQGSRELKQAMEITAVYEPARTSEGVAVLVRKGDVDVDFPGPSKRLTVSQAGLKRTIQKKFANMFPELLLNRPLEVPQTVKIDAIRGRVFHANLVDAKDGWLTIAVQ